MFKGIFKRFCTFRNVDILGLKGFSKCRIFIFPHNILFFFSNCFPLAYHTYYLPKKLLYLQMKLLQISTIRYQVIGMVG